MNYHFIGLGGIGMSALARILKQQGARVQGSDLSSSALLNALQREGVCVHCNHDPAHLAPGMEVVYSSAVKETNPEYAEAKARGLPLLHRSELLNRLMSGKKPLLVTGTHGKTTTTALLTAVLLHAERDPSFAIGGILRALATNGRLGRGDYFIAEADESDRSFLKTPAYAAIVTNLEPDHLDFWGDFDALKEAFRQFCLASQHLFWCCDDLALASLRPKGRSYGFSQGADIQLSRFRQKDRITTFDLSLEGRAYADIALPLLGRYNALNAAAVFALSLFLGVSEEAIRGALLAFEGVQRRLELKGVVKEAAVYDDYGHHPTEIAVTLKALKQEIGQRRLFVLFQPHRYTRLRDHFDAFLTCFDDADVLVLTDLYSAGESPLPGVSSHRLYEELRAKRGSAVHFFSRRILEREVALLMEEGDVALTLGAGDITLAGEELLECLREIL